MHLTQAQVSERLGKSRPYIANYLRLLSLPKEVKEMLQAGQLSMGQARTLLSLKDKKNLVQLAKKTVKENLTVRQLEQLVSELNGEKNHKKVAKKKSCFRSTSEKERRSIKGTLRDKCCDQKHGTLEKGQDRNFVFIDG